MALNLLGIHLQTVLMQCLKAQRKTIYTEKKGEKVLLF